jgi:hypothetical protein
MDVMGYGKYPPVVFSVLGAGKHHCLSPIAMICKMLQNWEFRNNRNPFLSSVG